MQINNKQINIFQKQIIKSKYNSFKNKSIKTNPQEYTVWFKIIFDQFTRKINSL